MKERRVEVIDRTLIVLWNLYADKIKENIPKLKELVRLIYLIGSDYIEITPEIYEKLYPLPEDVQFRVNVNKVVEIKSVENVDSIINENNHVDSVNNIRIVGLDDLILYEYEEELLKLINVFGKGIEMCIGNSYCCSTAMAVEWLELGGHKVVTSFAGIGGYTPLEELLCSIEFIQNINLRGNHIILPKVLELFEEITGTKVPYNKPFIGKNIFDVESGIHVDGIEKNPKTFEPYDPSKIGRNRNIIIGKHSGAKAVEIKLNELNIPYEADKIKNILNEVRNKSIEEKRGLYNEEIVEICKKVGSCI